MFLFLISLQLIQGGKGEAIRIRAILRSLVPIQDLQGVISISFQIPSVSEGQQFLFRIQNHTQGSAHIHVQYICQ